MRAPRLCVTSRCRVPVPRPVNLVKKPMLDSVFAARLCSKASVHWSVRRKSWSLTTRKPLGTGIVRALSGQGYEIQEASDGDQALQTIRQFQPDVVLSDINMPAMDGLSLLKHLQAQAEDQPEVPLVVLITAYGSEEVVVKALRLGAYNYISKPFEIADLRVIIRNAVDKQRLLRENRRYLDRLQQTLAELRASQTALVQAEKMVSLGRLVAGIAHEMNTPLGVLQSGLKTIETAAARLKAGLTEPSGRCRRRLPDCRPTAGHRRPATPSLRQDCRDRSQASGVRPTRPRRFSNRRDPRRH